MQSRARRRVRYYFRARSFRGLWYDLSGATSLWTGWCGRRCGLIGLHRPFLRLRRSDAITRLRGSWCPFLLCRSLRRALRPRRILEDRHGHPLVSSIAQALIIPNVTQISSIPVAPASNRNISALVFGLLHAQHAAVHLRRLLCN
jgi:hypothetical protein